MLEEGALAHDVKLFEGLFKVAFILVDDVLNEARDKFYAVVSTGCLGLEVNLPV